MGSKKRIIQGGKRGKSDKNRKTGGSKNTRASIARTKTPKAQQGDKGIQKEILKDGAIAKRTFEECYSEIEALVERIRPQWTLDAVPHVCFDDIKSIIISHIFKKWHYYDPSLPLANWVAKITKYQFINQLRNLYLSTQKPCSRCPSNLGGDQCALYGTQSEECNLFDKWKKTKFNQHQARLPLPIENHQHEISNQPDASFDYEGMVVRLHAAMKKVLKPNQWRVYESLFINHQSEDDIAQEMGFRTSEAGRRRGYRRIMQIKKEIISEAKKILFGENDRVDIHSV